MPLAVLVGRADHQPRAAGPAAQNTEAGEQAFRLRATAAGRGHALNTLPQFRVDDRIMGVGVDDLAEAELAEQDPRAEEGSRAVEAASDPVLAEMFADLHHGRALGASAEG